MVKMTKETPFAPFTLSIEIETDREAQVLQKVFRANVRIPMMLASSDDITSEDRKLLINMMTTASDTMDGH